MIAFLGTGLLGSNFTKALLKKGHAVQVWNRTPIKSKALEAFGAKAFSGPQDAVKGATRIHLALSDDAAVDSVLEAASPSFETGVVIIDHTTTSAQGAVERTVLWKRRGFEYIHAPVFMGPVNAFEGTGFMLVSGEQGLLEKWEPELSAMTGKLINFGTDPSKAAAMKLLGNLFLICMTAGISETLSLAKSLAVPPSDLETLFSSWNPGALVPARLKRITNGKYSDASWELKMARKDARLMMNQAATGNAPLHLLPAIAQEMDRWIEKGHGNDDWVVIAKDNLP